MIRVHRGRGGWRASASGWSRAGGLAAVIMALAFFGCSSKNKPGAGGAGGPGGSGIGQEGVGGAGGSSLSALQSGSLGQNGQGGPLTDVHFDYNDFTIRTQDGEILRANAGWLTQHQGRVQIEGHCDDRGSEEYNIALGAKRAQAAKDYLQTLGIAPDRMSTISYGKELPLCTEENDDCWAQNRRDHFVVNQ